MPAIHLVPIAFHDTLSIESLREDLIDALRMDVQISSIQIDEEEAIDRSRQQYHSGLILASLLKASPSDDSKLLGVTTCDLFLPIFTFVFGQAQLDNRAAVFSTFRLSNEFYVMPASSGMFRERVLKEALHEIGHPFGLKHCFDIPCVMNSSTYVEDIDMKPVQYCDSCWEHIRSYPMDGLSRAKLEERE